MITACDWTCGWTSLACSRRARRRKRACEGGKIDLNGQAARPHREVKEGDELEISRPFGRKQKVVVPGLARKAHPEGGGPAPYEDLTPKPSPEEVELRRMARLAAPFMRRPAPGPLTSGKRELRKLKGRG